MIVTRSLPLWGLLWCLAASVTGVVGHALYVAAPRGQRVVRDVDGTNGTSTPTMTSWRVVTDVLYRYAKTSVATRLVNPASVAKEISFSAVLPQAAFISAFHIEMDGKVYDAYVKEKEAAKQEYQHARSRGWTAATVVKARDSNVFTVSVNVEAAGKVTFNLTYEELLTRKLGLYHHIISIDPGQIVPDLSLRVRVEDALPLANLSVPALRMSNEINPTDAVETEGGASGPATITRPSPEVAVVEWSPSAEEQRELRSEGLRAQLVVQYDVDRENNPAQILLGDGYFVHFYSPTTLTPLHKHVVFVLDVSGSMDGAKLPQLKEAMSTVLSDLREGDAFSIVLFESTVSVWQPNGTMYEVARYHNELTVPVEAVVPVNAENIALAKQFVSKLEPLGGTNIYDALMVALEVVKQGRRVYRSGKVGEVPEPMVAFLTDGQANSGAVTQSSRIVRAVTEKNKRQTPLFCLAFGRDADLDFLKQLALANSAFARLIYEAGDAALQLRDFYRQVSSPLLANVTFLYEPQQVDNSSLTTLHFGTLFAGSELVVAGRLAAHAEDETPEKLLGVVMAKAATGKARFGFPSPRVAICPVPPPPTEGDTSRRQAPFMERLWAHLTVQQLLDKERADGDPANSTGRARALELSLQYSFVTSLTSLVVVKPNATSAPSDPVEAGAGDVPAHPAGLQLSSGFYGSPAAYPGAPVPIAYSGASGLRGYSSSSSSSSRAGFPGQSGHFSMRNYAAAGPSLMVGGPSHTPIHDPVNYEDEFDADPLIAEDIIDHTTPRHLYPAPTQLTWPRYPPPAPPPPPPPAATSTVASARVYLTVNDITWGPGVKNATHVFLAMAPPGSTNVQTTAFLIGIGQPDVDTGICPSAGELSHCRHLPHCILPEFSDDYNKYVSTYFCAINGYAGVCCPDSRHAAAIAHLP